MKRRDFLVNSILLGLSFPSINSIFNKVEVTQDRKAKNWHGFNLYEFYFDNKYYPVNEWDYEFMAEWGFNYVRLPLNYWHWANKSNPFVIDENFFKELDRALNLAEQYKIHTSINLHRIPGYCINRGNLETFYLFTKEKNSSEKALEAAIFNWKYIAERYRNIPSNLLSFNLINEPPNMAEEMYLNVISPIIKTIRDISPTREIIVDGINVGKQPVMDLPKNIIQGARGYSPGQLTHFNSVAIKNSSVDIPTWPLKINNEIWDKKRLIKEFSSWKKLSQEGVDILIGEFGVLNTVSHDVTLSFMQDQLSIWREYGWGWAMWNLRGAFGPVNSNRKDVNYENYKGMKLDKEMLELLLKYK